MSILQEKPLALKREHPALKKLNLINLFSVFVGQFCPRDPDTDLGTPLNPDPIRIRPRIRIHSTVYMLRIVCCVTRTS
jgi:hypothetical protein